MGTPRPERETLTVEEVEELIREAKEEAWDEGQAGGYNCAQGYHAHGDGHGADSWDCGCPNPYHEQGPRD